MPVRVEKMRQSEDRTLFAESTESKSALAACRTDFLGCRGEARLLPCALVLRLIASKTLAEAPIAILAWAFWAAPSGLWPLQAGARTNIRFIFQAMVTRLHSPRAFSSPRIENLRNPSTDLIMPNNG